MSAYAELAVTTNFSFLRGASHPEEMIVQAHALGLAGIGIADRNSVAGVVRAHVAKRRLREKELDDADKGQAAGGRSIEELKIVVGARLVFADGTPDILAYPRDRTAWGRLTQLLTVGKSRADKGECTLFLDDLLEYIEGQNLIVLPPPSFVADDLAGLLSRLKQAASRNSVWLAASMLYRGDDKRRLARLMRVARGNVPLIAVNDALYHAPERRELQDVVTCIREGVTIDRAGRRLEANAERHLKSPEDMAWLFRAAPAALEETLAFIARCEFSLDQLQYEYPDETRAGYATPQLALQAFAEEGARNRYPGGLTPQVRKALDHELAVTAELKYAPYFLTVHDIVRYARSQGILCQGRGSAANSVICYCLGVTEVNPVKVDLLFERFVSAERREPPDIDVDFEHERREEVIQYIYNKYSRERAGIAATVICYRARSAVREVGKVFGLSEDTVAAMAGTIWGWSREAVAHSEIRRAGLDPADPKLQRVVRLSAELQGFPRHLSQHVGGFVITRSRLDTIVPVENAAMDERTFVEWDKDDLDALRILKVDVLGLGMLSCIRAAFDLLRDHYKLPFSIAQINAEEAEEDKLWQKTGRKPAVYRMICRADTVGVFQIESRAQMSMLPRLRPQKFYDLVIEVAIVRPGPIQGNMVHPYLKRRIALRERGIEPTYPSPGPPHDPNELKAVLSKTLGVPLFQEQAMRIAIVAAQFPPAKADSLRRAMATFKRAGTINNFREEFISGIVKRGYPPDFADRCFKQIEGFGSYGFPESHAASFAILVYVSAWLKCHYPDVFAAALLNSQPMGFYAPAQIVRDAQEHGVDIRPVDVNRSDWNCSLEPGPTAAARVHPRHADMAGDIYTTQAVRLGFREIKGFSEDDGRRIEAVRGRGFDSIRDLWLRTGFAPAVLERLARADAFRSLGLDRRDALWAVRALQRAGDKDDLPLFARVAMPELEPDVELPPMLPGEQVIEDYRHLSLSLKAHPVSFLRHELTARGILRHDELPNVAPGRVVTVAGLVLVRQRPGEGRAIFMTLEDETGIANTIMWIRTYEAYRPVVLGGRLVAVTGVLQNEANVIHVVAEQLQDLSPLLRTLSEHGASIESLAHCDEVKRPGPGNRSPKRIEEKARRDEMLFGAAAQTVAEVMPKGRNFH